MIQVQLRTFRSKFSRFGWLLAAVLLMILFEIFSSSNVVVWMEELIGDTYDI